MRRFWVGCASVALFALVVAGVQAPAAVAAPSRSGVNAAGPIKRAEAFSPPKSADGHKVVAASAPKGAWMLPSSKSTVSAKGVHTNSVPAGTTVGAPGIGSLPWFGMFKTELSLDTVAQVNLGNGNLLLTSADGQLNGPGTTLRSLRFYNGLSSAAGSFGGGWSSSLSQVDTGLQVSGSSATLLGANGFQVTFTKSGSTWNAPSGFDAQLSENAGSSSARYTVTYNQSGEQLQFSTSGYMTADLDRNGVGAHYAYNGSGQVSTVTQDSGRQDTVYWASSSSNVITQIQDSAGRSVQYQQNGSGQLERVTKPDGNYEVYSYDSTGRVTQALFTGTGPGDMEVDFGYDTSSRVTSIQQKLAYTSTVLASTSYVYSAGSTTVTDGNGHTSTYAIDSSGRVTSTTDALGHQRSQSWTANSDVATTTDALGAGSTPGNTTTYSYDALNNAVGVSYPTGAAASAVYAAGVSCPGAGSGNPNLPKCSKDDAGNGKQYTYDSAGNLTKVTDTTSGGTGAVPEQYTYDNASRSVCGGFAGQICTAKDGNGHTTSYSYDSNGNFVTVTPPSPLGAVTYDYDSLGRVLYVHDGNGKTTGYVYDDRDNIIQTNFDNLGSLNTWFYQNGFRYADQDGSGRKEYQYDGAGRMTQQTGPASGATITYGHDGAGNLTSYTDASGTVAYGYDNANELTSITEPSGTCGSGAPAASSGCIKIGYDANGAETSRTFPGGATVTTSRDLSGRATRITAKDTAGTTVADVGYSYTVAGGSGPTADRIDVQSRTSYLEQGITPGDVTAYNYDSLNRLTAATETGGATAASWAYSYDDAGNRTQQVRSGATGATAGTITYTYNAADELTATSADTSTWSYDGNGAQTRDGITGISQTVDTRGAVTAIGSTSYSVFGQGNTEQISRSTPSTSYAWSALGLGTETTAGTTIAYTRTDSGSVVSSRAGSGRDYFVQDSLGSVVGIFDASGAWQGGYSYGPYGEARYTGSSTAVTSNPIRYISGYLDLASGEYKLGARYYNASMGRFTQKDPSGQQLNPYQYVGCNPVNGADPDGLDASDCAGAIFFLVAAGLGVIIGVALLFVPVVQEAEVGVLVGLAGVGAFASGAAGAIGSAIDVGEKCS
jgi:RHS repeat-associated protein